MTGIPEVGAEFFIDFKFYLAFGTVFAAAVVTLIKMLRGDDELQNTVRKRYIRCSIGTMVVMAAVITVGTILVWD